MVNDSKPSQRTHAATTSGQITEEVLCAVRGTSDERLRVIIASLIRHAHDFARDVRLRPDELLAAADFLKRCGQVSDDAWHEVISLSDVLGLTMVVDTIAAEVPDGALEGSVLGPFYRANSPLEPNGADIARGADDGEPAHVHGRVLDLDGRPIAGAELEASRTERYVDQMITVRGRSSRSGQCGAAPSAQ